MAFKPSYNIMDRDTHNALVNAFKTGGIAYTDDDGTVHKIADDYINGGGGGGGGAMKATADMIVDAGTGDISFGTCSKTGTELANAIEGGIIPYLVLSMYAGETLLAISVCYAASYQTSEEGYITSFLLYDSSTASNKIILVYANGQMGISE